MSDRPEWFSAKSHGFGAGLPIVWQGWVLLIGFLALVIGAAVLLAERSIIAYLSVLIPASLLFMVIAAKTTRGGWRWRWGDRN